MRRLIYLALLFCATPAFAGDIQPFVRGSWKEIPSRTILSSNEIETSSNTMAAPDGCSAVAAENWSGREGVTIVQDPRITIRNRVTNTSTTIIRIIAATTASVVERPTPCVPPLVESP